MKQINIRIVKHFSINVEKGKENKITTFYSVQSEHKGFFGRTYWKDMSDFNHDLSDYFETEQDAYNAAVARFVPSPRDLVVKEFKLP